MVLQHVNVLKDGKELPEVVQVKAFNVKSQLITCNFPKLCIQFAYNFKEHTATLYIDVWHGSTTPHSEQYDFS